MKPNELRAALLESFEDASIEIEDLTGTENHYRVTIGSKAFAGKSRIAQHKMVYAALGDVVGADVHALALTTFVKA